MSLTISRDDVSSDGVTQFPVATRFIKLPIERFLKLIEGKKGDETNSAQFALINAINNPKYRFISAALARRVGKTFISNVIGHLVTLVPNCNVLIMSPNYALSTISFELQRMLVNKNGIEILRDNLKDKVLELTNGSSIRMGSVGQVDSSVGRSYDLIIFDEAALSEKGEDAFNIALRPTLDKPNAKAIFISTPRGQRNWFSRFYHRGFSEEYPQWISIHATYEVNPRVSEDDIKEAKKAMTKNHFAQEYLASFVSYEGQIYEFDGSNVIDYKPEGLEVFAGLDIGFKDATAMVVVAYDDRDQCYYILDEYKEAEQTTNKHAAAIRELMDEYNIDAIFIDAGAAQSAADLAYLYDIPTLKAKKAVLPGISFVQTIIKQNRLKVHSSCIETLNMLDSYMWDDSETLMRERPKHNDSSHIADSLRYAMYSFIT